MTRSAIDHGLLSPSGHMSKRARKAALARETRKLFPEGFNAAVAPQLPEQPSERERLLRQATELRELAARGMHKRSYLKKALELEALAEADCG